MVFFNGSLKLKILEALDLRPTEFATRHSVGPGKNAPVIDPYISIDVDDNPVARTNTKPRCTKPVWNEEFTTEVHNGQAIGITVFHDAAIPPDEFVANCTLAFEEIKSASDIWIRCSGGPIALLEEFRMAIYNPPGSFKLPVLDGEMVDAVLGTRRFKRLKTSVKGNLHVGNNMYDMVDLVVKCFR